MSIQQTIDEANVMIELESKLFEKSSLVSRNVRIGDKRTSVRLEPEMWEILDVIAELSDKSVNSIAQEVAERDRNGSFTSALRVFIVSWLVDATGIEIERYRIRLTGAMLTAPTNSTG